MKGFTLWLTGLPCSGKTTISEAVAARLRSSGYAVELLDGDAFRQKESGGLGYSKQDRETNIARAAEAATMLAGRDIVTLASFISPYRSMREAARRRIPNFIEVYVRCPLEVCEKRDVKGMYKLARSGRITTFTGVSDPYEEPLSPEITVDTDQMSLDECVAKILDHLSTHRWVSLNGGGAH
ncbi:MAG: adenylyl-sulfate kinase [Candidatus Omnitrophota bacterium]